MVTTTSDPSTASVVRIFGTASDRSIPISAITATTAGLISSAGVLPAERTTTLPAA